ncbi:hypothetical protein ACQKLP_20265 [Chitinophaga sp. NPDC101104]|uniref:hypothetical protein n=1 Tax=Chitinophaga sp. NPDC101104 TaxID=3390561 RepID=UPI003D086507
MAVLAAVSGWLDGMVCSFPSFIDLLLSFKANPCNPAGILLHIVICCYHNPAGISLEIMVRKDYEAGWEKLTKIILRKGVKGAEAA